MIDKIITHVDYHNNIDLEEGTQSTTLDDIASIDSNYEPETKTMSDLRKSRVRATLESDAYDAGAIRKEFETYRHILPTPDKLLQEQHSCHLLRKIFEEHNIELPRFLRYNTENGIKPHHALCCLLLSEWHDIQTMNKEKQSSSFPSLVELLTCGKLHPQLNSPAEFIRDQFNRVAHVIPLDIVTQPLLRKKIKNRGLPVPKYFLDPEEFPAHIALLVILQDGLHESSKFDKILYHIFFSLFAFVALLLRIVLEVIGGAGAIWGGAEVFTLRHGGNAELWRWISVGVGILCFLRFLVLNIPQKEDVGDILGPAGPWSLRLPVRMRAVCNHPFHYFVRV